MHGMQLDHTFLKCSGWGKGEEMRSWVRLLLLDLADVAVQSCQLAVPCTSSELPVSQSHQNPLFPFAQTNPKSLQMMYNMSCSLLDLLVQ